MGARAASAACCARARAPEHLSVGEVAAARRARALVRELGDQRAAPTTHAAIAGAAVVVVAVKPQEVARACSRRWPAPLRRAPAARHLGGRRRAHRLARRRGAPGVPVVRAMPNRPALVGAGVTGLYAPAADRRAAQRALAEAGAAARWARSCGWTTEEALDVVTALSGSGPAYFFLLAELMAEAAEQLGLEAASRAAAGVGDAARRGPAGARRATRTWRGCARRSPPRAAPPRRRSTCFERADLRGSVPQRARSRDAAQPRAGGNAPAEPARRPPA